MSKRPGIKLKVASPCPAKWDDMKGDDAVRHCDSCDKDVFQISNMSTEQVEEFLLSRKGFRTCVRFFQRADGTLLTGDCSVGKQARRKRRVISAVGAAAVGASALGLSFGSSPEPSSAGSDCALQASPTTPEAASPKTAPPPKPEAVHEIQGELPSEPRYREILGDVGYDPGEDFGEELGELEE